jgi:hypothetical protein
MNDISNMAVAMFSKTGTPQTPYMPCSVRLFAKYANHKKIYPNEFYVAYIPIIRVTTS